MLVLAAIVATLGSRAGVWNVSDLLLWGDTTDEYYRTVTTLFFYGHTGYEIVALAAIFLFGWLLERRHGPWAPLLVVSFPVFEREEGGGLTFMHMPFVAPVEEDLPLLDSDPLAVRGTHYDVVMNGFELGSGSLRNHRGDVQRRIGLTVRSDWHPTALQSELIETLRRIARSEAAR